MSLVGVYNDTTSLEIMYKRLQINTELSLIGTILK